MAKNRAAAARNTGRQSSVEQTPEWRQTFGTARFARNGSASGWVQLAQKRCVLIDNTLWTNPPNEAWPRAGYTVYAAGGAGFERSEMKHVATLAEAWTWFISAKLEGLVD